MTDFWKRKLAAYLHDPPSKALDIKTHGERSDAAFHRAEFIDTEVGDYFKLADHTGAAADRLPFPASQTSALHCAFDGIRNGFLHPLDGTKLPFHAEFKSAEQGIEGEESVQPLLTAESLASLPDESLRWRARFFAHWRLWQKHAVEKDYRLALLPADTRIPDHSIWTHMQVVSALDGCIGDDKVWHPAFLKFQLGPVQDFIAAARSIRDLWSGSYLLSWLMAAGLKALTAKVGPDAVIFPNLRGQPLFDLHWRDELWCKVKIGDQSVWDRSLDWQNSKLLTPNLPNVFLAVVPAERAAELGKTVKTAIENEWTRIAEAVWNSCQEAGLTNDEGGITALDRKARFDGQIARFLSLSWQATPWPNSLEDALQLADGCDPEMPIQKARERVQGVVDMAEKHMPKDHRDVRYFECDMFPKGHPKAGWKDRSKLKDDAKLDNIGLGWSVIVAFNSWALDAVRQTRHFDAANKGGWQTGTFNNKDALTGRDEAMAGGEDWSKRANNAKEFWPSLFKKGDWLSASTLVKRVWHRAYLEKVCGLRTDKKGFPMPNTRGIAAHQPEQDCGDDETAEDEAYSEKYFAVLALDGDKIGKWMSGEKTPLFSGQLADYRDSSNAQRYGAKPYFEKPEFKDFLEARRPLSPSYHLQFSEALSNFALLCARPIVEAFYGRLIYAGGDDVVALLPADTALVCSEALRLAFTGREVKALNGKVLFHSPQPGFLSSDEWKDDNGHGRPIPFLVPGPAVDCSVGIAIAHFKAPLQDVVRAAQAAEKRAKKQLDRKAVAVTLFKRSGETIKWGCKWDGGGLDLYRAIAVALESEQLSSKFPYRVIELLNPYLTQHTGLAKTMPTPGFDAVADEIIQREFAVACGRQRGPAWTNEVTDQLCHLLAGYVARLDKVENKLRDVIGLCQTVAFAHRTRSNESQSATSAVMPPTERQTQP
jgi:CRISPR-associated protein Cmr2